MGEEPWFTLNDRIEPGPALVGLPLRRLNLCIAHRMRCALMRRTRKFNPEG
jgi:hypothetical protein